MMSNINKQNNTNYERLFSASGKALGSLTDITKKLKLKATLLSVASTLENASRSSVASTIKESSQFLSSDVGKACIYGAPVFGVLILAGSVDAESAAVAVKQCMNVLSNSSPLDANSLYELSGAISNVKTDENAMLTGLASLTVGAVSSAAKYLSNRLKESIPTISPTFYENTVHEMAKDIVEIYNKSSDTLTDSEKVEVAFKSILDEQKSWVSSEKLDKHLINHLGQLAVKEYAQEIADTSEKDTNLAYPRVVY
jgi:hypothetical protein